MKWADRMEATVNSLGQDVSASRAFLQTVPVLKEAQDQKFSEINARLAAHDEVLKNVVDTSGRIERSQYDNGQKLDALILHLLPGRRFGEADVPDDHSH